MGFFAEQLLNDLWLLSREVYLPLVCVSRAEEHHVLDRLLDSMHCLIAATEVLSSHAKVRWFLLMQLWACCSTQVRTYSWYALKFFILSCNICILCSKTALHKSNILERYSLVQYGMENMASVGKQVLHHTELYCGILIIVVSGLGTLELMPFGFPSCRPVYLFHPFTASFLLHTIAPSSAFTL